MRVRGKPAKRRPGYQKQVQEYPDKMMRPVEVKQVNMEEVNNYRKMLVERYSMTPEEVAKVIKEKFGV